MSAFDFFIVGFMIVIAVGLACAGIVDHINNKSEELASHVSKVEDKIVYTRSRIDCIESCLVEIECLIKENKYPMDCSTCRHKTFDSNCLGCDHYPDKGNKWEAPV